MTQCNESDVCEFRLFAAVGGGWVGRAYRWDKGTVGAVREMATGEPGDTPEGALAAVRAALPGTQK